MKPSQWKWIPLTLILAGVPLRGEELTQEQGDATLPCVKESHDESGRIKSCTLDRDAVISGHAFPAGSRLGFDSEGRLDCCFLARETTLQGHRCRGKGHNYQTCFHPKGTLRFFNLVEPEYIQGVLCEKSTFWRWVFSGNAGVELHENGSLSSCLLAEDVQLEDKLFKKGRRVAFDQAGKVIAR